MNTVVKAVGKADQKGESEAKSGSRAKGKERGTRALRRHFKYIVPQYRLILVKEPGIKPTKIEDPISFHHFVQPLAHYSEEHFIAFHLDVKFQVIGYHEVSKGTLSASLVHPREVFKAALLSNAHAIIVAHNHPSGSVVASREDIETTKRLIKAGKIMGVEVVDHCIVTSESMNSLRETEPRLWDA
jgi:DNA repair protein RadC